MVNFKYTNINKMKRSILVFISLLFFLMLFFAFRPVTTPSEKDCLVYTGIVEKIGTGRDNDLTIQLKGSDKTYYINRGIEKGMDLSKLQNQLIGQEVTIKYPKYWTPLDPFNKIKHISHIEYGNQILFTELK